MLPKLVLEQLRALRLREPELSVTPDRVRDLDYPLLVLIYPAPSSLLYHG